MREYAKSLGKSEQDLTQAEKAQAVYVGVMTETEAVVGNAATYSEQLGGVMAENSAQVKKLAQYYGSALEPAVKDFNIVMTKVIASLANFTKENQGLVAGATTSIGTFLTLGTTILALAKGIEVIKSLKMAIDTAKVSATGFSATLGPIGIALTALVSIGIGVFTSIRTEMEKAKEEQKALNEEVENFNKLMKDATTDLNIGLKETELENLKTAKENLKEMAEFSKNKSFTFDGKISQKQFD